MRVLCVVVFKVEPEGPKKTLSGRGWCHLSEPPGDRLDDVARADLTFLHILEFVHTNYHRSSSFYHIFVYNVHTIS